MDSLFFVNHTLRPSLAPFISSIWYFEGTFAHQRERIVPNGEMQLLVNLDADELRSYHGVTPAAYRPRSPNEPNHIALPSPPPPAANDAAP